MKLTYIYHSGFAIEGEDFTIIIDYYKDSADRVVHDFFLGRPGRLYVLVSHSHADHFNPEILAWQENRKDIRYIFSKDVPEYPGITYLNKLDSYQDEILNIKAFGSTDIDISFLIKVKNKTIFHAGDLNNWHWEEESTPEEAQEYENNYLQELEILAKETTHVNLAMFPVDPRLGKDYMRGARQFIDRIKTDLFAPMRFQEAYDKAAAFHVYAEGKGCRFAEWKQPGESIEF